jgi:hypothetical protein
MRPAFARAVRNSSPFADFIGRDLTLAVALEPIDFRISFLQVLLAHTTVHPFSPEIETAALEIVPHQFNHLRFGKTELN